MGHDLRMGSDVGDGASGAWALQGAGLSGNMKYSKALLLTLASETTIVRVTLTVLVSPSCEVGSYSDVDASEFGKIGNCFARALTGEVSCVVPISANQSDGIAKNGSCHLMGMKIS